MFWSKSRNQECKGTMIQGREEQWGGEWQDTNDLKGEMGKLRGLIRVDKGA